MTDTSKSFARETLDQIRSKLTDTSPNAVERLSPCAVDGGCDAYGQMEEDHIGDYVTYEDYAALSAQLEAANQRSYYLAYAIAGGEDAPGLLDTVSTDELCKMIRDERAWSRDAEFSAPANGKAEGLRLAVDCIGHITQSEDRDPNLREIPADTPAKASSLPAGKWCACGFPHETGGPCWECRAIAGGKE